MCDGIWSPRWPLLGSLAAAQEDGGWFPCPNGRDYDTSKTCDVNNIQYPLDNSFLLVYYLWCCRSLLLGFKTALLLAAPGNVLFFFCDGLRWFSPAGTSPRGLCRRSRGRRLEDASLSSSNGKIIPRTEVAGVLAGALDRSCRKNTEHSPIVVDFFKKNLALLGDHLRWLKKWGSPTKSPGLLKG